MLSLPSAALEHLLGLAPAQFAEAQKLLFQIVAHAIVQPVDDVPEAFALIISDDDLPVLRLHRLFRRQVIHKAGDHVFADLHQIALVDVAVG